jgi:hypothetical protein
MFHEFTRDQQQQLPAPPQPSPARPADLTPTTSPVAEAEQDWRLRPPAGLPRADTLTGGEPHPGF